jgi:hypothetical protein
MFEDLLNAVVIGYLLIVLVLLIVAPGEAKVLADEGDCRSDCIDDLCGALRLPRITRITSEMTLRARSSLLPNAVPRAV